MDINKIIEYTDEVKPNVISDELKFGWVSSLDSRINREILGKNEEIIYKSGEDGEKALLVPPPFDEIYYHYVSAMIDFSNNEISSYTNNMLLYNEKFDEFAKNYRRSNMPGGSGGFYNVI